MRILLLGANGQLGRTFVRDGGLAARSTLVAATREGVLRDGTPCASCDLALAGLGTLLDEINPQVIVNTAAYTAVDRAEQEEALATRINGKAVEELGQWAAARGALVLHYSTDYVFDGNAATPYPVHAAPRPLNAYGRSKLAGEDALRASGADHLILRTAWVYAPFGNNFMRSMLRLGAERDELRIVADQSGTPTPTALIVRATLAALDRWQLASATDKRTLAGTYHVVASGATSWYGFATEIFRLALERGLLQHSPRLIPIASSEYPALATRPRYSVLDSASFCRTFDFVPPDWRKGLIEVIDQLADQA